MKPYTFFLSVSFFCLIFHPISSQIPDNFEFLNHKFRKSKLGATKVLNNEVYYVNHVPFFRTASSISRGGTFVYRINGLNEPEVVFETFFTSTSKIIENPDSSFDIIIQNLIDYDLLISGFVSINIDSNNIKIDTITRIPFDGNSAEGVLKDVIDLFDVDKTENGDWLGTGSNDYFVFNETGLIDTVDYTDKNYYELLNNENQDLFGLSLDENSVNSTVYRLIDESVDSITTIEGSIRLQNLLNDQSGNYILSSDKLMQYSVDFTQLLNEWSLADFNGEISAINSSNDIIEVLVDTGKLYELMPNGNITLVSENLSLPDENNQFFRRLDSEQVVFGGIHDFESISENVYFRNVDVIDNSSVDYPRVDVAIDNVELFMNNQEFNIKTDVTNQGDERLNHIDLYSRFFQPDAPIFLRYFLDLSWQDVSIGEIIRFDTTTVNFAIDDLSFVVPGGDYKFNSSPQGFWTGDITSSTSEISKENLLDFYPNPTHDFIQIDSGEKLNCIAVYNEIGQMVYFEEKVIDNKVSVSHMDSGIYYILSWEDENKNLRAGKFVKK